MQLENGSWYPELVSSSSSPCQTNLWTDAFKQQPFTGRGGVCVLHTEDRSSAQYGGQGLLLRLIIGYAERASEEETVSGSHSSLSIVCLSYQASPVQWGWMQYCRAFTVFCWRPIFTQWRHVKEFEVEEVSCDTGVVWRHQMLRSPVYLCTSIIILHCQGDHFKHLFWF